MTKHSESYQRLLQQDFNSELSHIQLQLQLVDLVTGLVEVLQLLLKVQARHDIRITI